MQVCSTKFWVLSMPFVRVWTLILFGGGGGGEGRIKEQSKLLLISVEQRMFVSVDRWFVSNAQCTMKATFYQVKVGKILWLNVLLHSVTLTEWFILSIQRRVNRKGYIGTKDKSSSHSHTSHQVIHTQAIKSFTHMSSSHSHTSPIFCSYYTSHHDWTELGINEAEWTEKSKN